MGKFFNSYATPLTTGLFLVSLISGVALFLGLGPAYFHGMHEWLSMVLILPFVLHIWRNWRPFLGYFKRAPMAIALAVSVAAAAAFVVPVMGAEGGRSGPPQFALAHLALGAPIADVAPILGLDGAGLVTKLQGLGYTVSGPGQTLLEVAAASEKSEMEIAGALVAPSAAN